MIATHIKGQDESSAARALRSAMETDAESSGMQSDSDSSNARLAPARSNSIKLNICEMGKINVVIK